MTMHNARLGLLTIGCVSFLSTAHAAAPKSAQTGTTQAGSGVLEAAQREYTPQSCSHNGNTMLCTFGVVNRGNPLTLHAWPGDLRTLQLVDASHVPHSPNRAYFVDAAGAHQAQLLLQEGDQGSIIVEFPNVDANGTASEFHLHSQIVGGVGGTQTAASAGQTASAPAAGQTTPTPTTGKSANAPSTAKTTAAPAASTATGTQTPGGTGRAAAPAAMAAESGSCASNPKSAACRSTQQEERVCAKNANSAACKNATARAKKAGATG